MEHYREWLRSQNIIDSIRNADIEESGVTDIPPCNKHPGYSGYPSTAESHVENRHAIPGPSRPRMGTMERAPCLPRNRLAIPVALRLMVFPSRRRGIVATRITLVTQTMEVRLMKPTYRVALGIQSWTAKSNKFGDRILDAPVTAEICLSQQKYTVWD